MDHVYICVIPRKSSLKIGSCDNLDPRCCGPFKVLDRIQPVLYRFAFPANTKSLNVFHVSFLKKGP